MTTMTLPRGSHDIPTTDDGGNYPYALVLQDSTIYSTSCTELVAALIGDDYPIGDEDAALLVRWEHAVATAVQAQAELAARAVEDGTFNPSEHTEEHLTMLLGARDTAVEVAFWPPEGGPKVPLVLVATDYAPTGIAPAPAGDVLFIDPGDEAAFLRTLASAGLIDFLVDAEA